MAEDKAHMKNSSGEDMDPSAEDVKPKCEKSTDESRPPVAGKLLFFPDGNGIFILRVLHMNHDQVLLF